MFIFLVYIPRGEIAGSLLILCLTCWRTAKLFCAILHFHQQCTRYILTNTCYCSFSSLSKPSIVVSVEWCLLIHLKFLWKCLIFSRNNRKTYEEKSISTFAPLHPFPPCTPHPEEGPSTSFSCSGLRCIRGCCWKIAKIDLYGAQDTYSRSVSAALNALRSLQCFCPRQLLVQQPTQ